MSIPQLPGGYEAGTLCRANLLTCREFVIIIQLANDSICGVIQLHSTAVLAVIHLDLANNRVTFDAMLLMLLKDNLQLNIVQ